MPATHRNQSSRAATRAQVAAALAPLAGRIAPPLHALAAAHGRLRRMAAGARLFDAGDPVPGLVLVVDGAVRVVRETPARTVVVHHEHAGGLLGEVALFAGTAYPATAVATEPTVVLLIGADAVRSALASSPALAELLLARLARRTQEVIERLDRLATLTVARRLASHLHARAGQARADVITLGMTQVQLAEELGTVKEVITRELRMLVQRGVIAAHGGGRYRILDRPALGERAGV